MVPGICKGFVDQGLAEACAGGAGEFGGGKGHA
jgi:hypothetical protein